MAENSHEITLHPNPFSEARQSLTPLYDAAERYVQHPVTFIPGAMLGLLAVLSTLLCILLWPYGLVVVLGDLICQSIAITYSEIKNVENPFARIPFAITLCIYAIVLLVIGYCCIPFFMLWGAVELVGDMMKAPEWGKVIYDLFLLLLAEAVGVAALVYIPVLVAMVL